MALSKEEKVWLIGETQRDGYETIAEWLTNLSHARFAADAMKSSILKGQTDD